MLGLLVHNLPDRARGVYDASKRRGTMSRLPAFRIDNLERRHDVLKILYLLQVRFYKPPVTSLEAHLPPVHRILHN